MILNSFMLHNPLLRDRENVKRHRISRVYHQGYIVENANFKIVYAPQSTIMYFIVLTEFNKLFGI